MLIRSSTEILSTLVLLTIGLLAGCELLGLGSDPPLADTTWELQTFTENEESVLIPTGQTYEVAFGSESVGVVADCNECSGIYTTNGSDITLTISCTENQCAPPTIAREYINALLSAETYQLESDELTVTYTRSQETSGTLFFRNAQ